MARLHLLPLAAAVLLLAAAVPATTGLATTGGKVGLSLLGSVPFPAAEQVG